MHRVQSYATDFMQQLLRGYILILGLAIGNQVMLFISSWILLGSKHHFQLEIRHGSANGRVQSILMGCHALFPTNSFLLPPVEQRRCGWGCTGATNRGLVASSLPHRLKKTPRETQARRRERQIVSQDFTSRKSMGPTKPGCEASSSIVSLSNSSYKFQRFLCVSMLTSRKQQQTHLLKRTSHIHTYPWYACKYTYYTYSHQYYIFLTQEPQGPGILYKPTCKESSPGGREPLRIEFAAL